MTKTIATHEAQPIIWHEYAALFPMLDGHALDALRDDIRQHGVREPVVMYQGKVLDGRNRYKCAADLGLAVPVREYDGEDALAFVISTNLHRRHLSESQRAMVAARLANMQHGGNRKAQAGQAANLPLEAPVAPSVSISDAAEMLSVSDRSVRTARRVQDAAPIEVARAVEDGRMSVSLAAKVADLPEAAQAEIIAAVPEAMKDVAREEVKKAHVANNSGNNEWYTPETFILSARAVMGGIDLDPASSEIANRTVGAVQIFTAQDDGLKQDWPIGRLWMNPPYAQPLMGMFADRFASEVRRGSEGVVLVNNATETAWFQTIAAECSAICFPKSRIKFLDPDGNPGAPLQGQAIIYCGPNADAFAAEFGKYGLVVRHG